MSGPIVLALRVILAIALYSFLIWGLFILWQGFRQQTFFISTRRIPPITFSYQLPPLGQQVRHFTQTEVTIGRNPGCDCAINEDAISSRHARVGYHHGHWWLDDLHSKNGTYLNNEKISMSTIIISGDEIRCGFTSITVNITGESIPALDKRVQKNDNT